MTKLNVNGRDIALDIDPETPLLWAIRDELRLTGTKFGCGVASCGACTVMIDGVPTRSCQTMVGDIEGATITTIEGMEGKVVAAVQAAWTAIDVPQCGWCQSGQIIAASALLAENPKPTDADIDAAMEGNACRCATYVRIRQAIHNASDALEG